MESLYVMTGKTAYKDITIFWGKFGQEFASAFANLAIYGLLQLYKTLSSKGTTRDVHYGHFPF